MPCASQLGVPGAWRGSYLCVNGRGEVAEQPYVVLLAGLHVHHQTRVQVPQLRGLGEGLVEVHLPRRSFARRERCAGESGARLPPLPRRGPERRYDTELSLGRQREPGRFPAIPLPGF